MVKNGYFFGVPQKSSKIVILGVKNSKVANFPNLKSSIKFQKNEKTRIKYRKTLFLAFLGVFSSIDQRDFTIE